MIESFNDPGRELTGTDAMEAMAKELPRVMAIKAAQQDLERAGRSCVLRQTRTISLVIDGHACAFVRVDDLAALQDALEALTKARLL